MKVFDRKTVTALRVEIDAALAVVAKKHGINLSLGSISFRPNQLTTRLTGTCDAAEEGNVESRWAKGLRDPFRPKGIDAGRKFKFAGKEYEVSGYLPRAKNCVVAKLVGTDKEYKFHPADIFPKEFKRDAEEELSREASIERRAARAEAKAEADFERRANRR